VLERGVPRLNELGLAKGKGSILQFPFLAASHGGEKQYVRIEECELRNMLVNIAKGRKHPSGPRRRFELNPASLSRTSKRKPF